MGVAYISHTLPQMMEEDAMDMVTSTDPKKPRLDIHLSGEQESTIQAAVDPEQDIAESESTLQLQEVTVAYSSEEDGESSSSGEEEEEEGEEGSDMRTQVKEFFAELRLEEGKQKRRLVEEGVRIPRRKSLLPSHLHSVMGNANLRLARGDTGAAIELCMEIIRQAPHASEPYLTLATIYEDMGDTKKLLQIVMIVAHLKRTDVDLWAKSASLAIEQHKFPIAAQCLSKAIHFDPTNQTYLWQRASVYCEMNEHKKAIESFDMLLKLLPPEASQQRIEVSKEMATLYHEGKETHKAIEVLSNVLEMHPEYVDEELINILAELCIMTKGYQQVYEVITNFYNMLPSLPQATSADDHVMSHDSDSALPTLSTALRLSIAGETLDQDPIELQPIIGDDKIQDVALEIPDDMPVDLRVKLAVSMIQLAKTVPEDLLQPIFVSPDDYGDLYLDIADAYMENNEYAEALPLLFALVQTAKYSQAGVWLKYAECQHMLNDLEAAAASYSKVITLAPNHTDTRLQLATLYVQLGTVDEALLVLESDPNAIKEDGEQDSEGEGVLPACPSSDSMKKGHEAQDLRVLIHKYKLLLNKGRLKEYVTAGCEMLAFFFRDVYNRPEVKVIMHLKVNKKKHFRSMPESSKEEKEVEGLLSLHEWFQVFVKTLSGLWKLGPPYYHRMVYLIYCAVITGKFGKELEKKFIFFSASLVYLLKDYGTTFMLLREYCYVEPNSAHLWNFMNMLPLDIKVQKFVLRLAFKYREQAMNVHQMRVLSNFSHVSSHYKFALSQYEMAYRENKEDYLLILCIAIVYINMASQAKHPPNRNAVVTQGAAFLHKYLKLRGHCQESMFNLARAYHQLGIMHVACHFYKQVLILEPECKLPQWSEVSDLRSEAAFNLSLIYRASGNDILALQMLQRYCRI